MPVAGREAVISRGGGPLGDGGPAVTMGRLDLSLRTELGGRTAGALEKAFGLRTVGDLLTHYPKRYLATGEPTPITDLVGEELATIIADVQKVSTRQMRQRRGSITDVEVTDGRSVLKLTFFNQPWRANTLKPGTRGVFSGKVTSYRGELQLVQPEFAELDVSHDDMLPLELVAGSAAPVAGFDEQGIPPLVPIYAATSGLRSWRIWSIVLHVLRTLGPADVGDPVPADVLRGMGLLSRHEALVAVHRPMSQAAADAALRRLRFEEAFVLQTGLVQRRREARSRAAAVRRADPLGLLAAFDEQLPFTLTDGQRRIGEEIATDLAAGSPMQRLLQGDVGSGKTLVALRAMLTVVDSGGQAALLAPTEVLAVQHHRTITAMLGALGQAGMLGGDDRGTRVALLTGSLSAAARRAALAEIAAGGAGIVVGTHALLSDPVSFADLGLVVVDEQHRFGVEQRDALRTAAEDREQAVPHLLVMTATPIPRTVAMTVFGDLDVSLLQDMPAGRPDVATHVVSLAEHPAWLSRVWGRVAEEVAAGGQAFVVCPRIGGGEPDDAAESGLLDIAGDGAGAAAGLTETRPAVAVLEMIETLRGEPVLTGLRIEVLHGRLPADEKDATMRAFAAGDIDVLVATTVIEVGVDVPNASVMAILDADRFGISQLHQLRGRIGRGTRPGVCLLVSAAVVDSPAHRRVTAVAATRDGLELARLDLEQRREGDVLGSAQSGRRSSLKLLRVLRDEQLITKARAHAQVMLDADPELAGFAELRAAVARALTDGRDEFIDRG